MSTGYNAATTMCKCKRFKCKANGFTSTARFLVQVLAKKCVMKTFVILNSNISILHLFRFFFQFLRRKFFSTEIELRLELIPLSNWKPDFKKLYQLILTLC